MRAPLAPGREWAPEAVAPAPVAARRLASLAASTARDLLPAAVGLAVALAAWEAYVRARNVKEHLVPAPSRVAERLYEDPLRYVEAGLHTLQGALLGFGIGSAVAILLAIVMSQSRFLERAIFPSVILIKVTPIVAIAPLLTIWFGFGLVPKLFISSLIVFFPVMVNALVGFRSVNANALALLQSLAANRVEVFLKLRLPTSLPYLFAAFKVAIPLSVIGTVVAEWYSGDTGLGHLIFIANSNLQMPTAFAGIASLAVIGIGLFLITMAIEKRVLFWHESSFDVR